jgi:hypothetical protein
MRAILVICVSALFVPLILGNLHCSTGDEPEVVVVPVGEPGSGDPYDSTGDMGCGGTTSAVQVDSDTVLLAFRGTRDTWLIYISESYVKSVYDRLEEEDVLPSYENLEPAQVDELQKKFCGGSDLQSVQERRIYEIVSETLGTKMNEIVRDVCD